MRQEMAATDRLPLVDFTFSHALPAGFSAGSARHAASAKQARYLDFEGSLEPAGAGVLVRFEAGRHSGRFPASEYDRCYQESARAMAFFGSPLELTRR